MSPSALRQKPTAWLSACTVAALVSAGGPTPSLAQAAESIRIMECVDPAALSATLRADGQKFLLNGTKVGTFINSQGKEYAFYLGSDFTSRPDGSVGYITQQCNDDRGKPTGQVKLLARLQDVRLFDDALTAPLPEMYVRTSKAEGDHSCMTQAKVSCSFHNDAIDSIYSKGNRVILQAFMPDKGQIVTVGLNKGFRDGRGAVLSITDARTGALFDASVYRPIDYSQFALSVGKKVPVTR